VSKGSVPRPVNKEKFDKNWDSIFEEKKNEKPMPKSDQLPKNQPSNNKR
tara:strand:- start:1901 stop:2047 length:147 start_codon:yes stop_codon:yes gene_type:complete